MTSTGAASSPNVSSNNSSATKVVIPNKNVSESRGTQYHPPFLRTYLLYVSSLIIYVLILYHHRTYYSAVAVVSTFIQATYTTAL